MYGYVAPSTKELKYKVSRKMPDDLRNIAIRLMQGEGCKQSKLLAEITSKHHDPIQVMLVPAVRLYIYYLQNPQQFGHNVSNVTPHIFQSMKRALLSIAKTVKVKPKVYIPIPNIFVRNNSDLLASCLYNHVIKNKIYKEYIQETCIERLTPEQMITKWLRTNKPTVCSDSYGYIAYDY